MINGLFRVKLTKTIGVKNGVHYDSAKKLPKSLSEELGNILFEELKLKNWDDPKMPEEFKTDA